MDSAILFVVGGLLVVAGVIGLLFPALPGAPLLFAGLVVTAWAENFEYVGTGTLIILAVIALLTYVVDIVAGMLGVKRFGASSYAMFGAVVGAVFGMFFGLFGILLGPFVGASIGEYLKVRDMPRAGRAGVGATLGLIIGTAAKIALAVSMVGIFALARFF